jgi:TolB protein
MRYQGSQPEQSGVTKDNSFLMFLTMRRYLFLFSLLVLFAACNLPFMENDASPQPPSISTYDSDATAFAPSPSTWETSTTGVGQQTDLEFPFAYETRQDGAHRLTDQDGDISAQNAAFSPSGEMMLFTMFHNGYNAGPAGLYLLSLIDGEITTLLYEDGQDSVNLPGSSWNSLTNRITFASDRQDTDEIWTIAPDGTELFRVTDHETPGYYLEPSFSPDGHWIVFEADEDAPDELQENKIWKVRADGSHLTQLTYDIYDDRQPNWSPTGDWILFQRRTPRQDDWNIYIMAPDGSDIQRVTFNPESADTDISWSPKGTCLVYSTDNGELPVPNIFVIPVEEGEPVRITFSDRYEDGAPSWSPDGRWIAFESHNEQHEDSPSSMWIIAVPAGLCE